MSISIWWIRRDLRLADNQALRAALEQSSEIIPVFIQDLALLESPNMGPRRANWLWSGLRELEQRLRDRGSRLIFRQGDPDRVLVELVAETHAEAIYAEVDYSPYARRRDGRIQKTLPLHLTPGLTVHEPDIVRKSDGSPYTVYTPFSKAWKALPLPVANQLIPAPVRLQTPKEITSLMLPQISEQAMNSAFPVGEAEALRRLETFTSGPQAAIGSYKERRNHPDWDGTSLLSPYFRFGMLSARTAVVKALTLLDQLPTADARDGARTWLNELIWREFYVSILYHFPRVSRSNFRQQFDAIRWRNDQAEFDAWRQGQTGYPFVDAAMRQLLVSGWMHNRARMVVASFLVKDLLIDWRWGERHFMQHLLDGDPAANNGGWQWAAGTGTDAAPYFRIFNPVLQSQKFDPAGSYIRRWVPELANVPNRYIHAPWEMPADQQRQAGCIIGSHYPGPIVDHQLARERTLAAYQAVK